MIEKAKAYDGKQEFYTEDSWNTFAEALNVAKSESTNENSTPETVKKAYDRLNKAIKGLTYKEVDKTNLNKLIEKAKAYDGKQEFYTEDSWKSFSDALAAAKSEYKSENSTPETVKDAQEKLDAAIKGLTYMNVDKAQLQTLIETARGKAEEDYTTESWNVFAEALGNAEDELNSENSTPETVKDAQEKLDAAIKDLALKKQVDKSKLEALIAEATGKVESQYTPESWTAFTTALGTANEVNGNKDATQETVDQACVNLRAGIDRLTAKADKTQLQALIDEASNKNKDEYTEESWETFANALAEARSVFEDENATPESVDQAHRKLNEAINGLTVKVKPELKELIDQVQDKKSEDYTDASWDAFETALEEAKAVFENEAATSEQISQAYRKLDEAIKGLAVKADKSELTTVIASSVTLNESDYTPESWKQFKEALDYADEVSANPNVSQEEVDEAKDKLEKAVKNLVKATGSEQKPTEKPDTKPDIKPEQKPTDKPVQKPTEKPSKNNGTNTGTSTHVGIFATTALASATAVLGLFGYKRRNKKK